eukprot:1769604-Rhodomonas_salina.1
MRRGHGRGLAKAKQEWLLRPQKLGRDGRRGVAEALPRRREEEAAELTRDWRGQRWVDRKRGGSTLVGGEEDSRELARSEEKSAEMEREEESMASVEQRKRE